MNKTTVQPVWVSVHPEFRVRNGILQKITGPKQTWVLCGGEDGGWQVKKDFGAKAIKRFGKQKDAIKFARKVAQREGGELVIQASDGKIREKTTAKA